MRESSEKRVPRQLLAKPFAKNTQLPQELFDNTLPHGKVPRKEGQCFWCNYVRFYPDLIEKYPTLTARATKLLHVPRTKFGCSSCEVPVYKECFEPYHDYRRQLEKNPKVCYFLRAPIPKSNQTCLGRLHRAGKSARSQSSLHL